eukprot:2422446-Prymnesium_polylepis.1
MVHLKQRGSRVRGKQPNAKKPHSLIYNVRLNAVVSKRKARCHHLRHGQRLYYPRGVKRQQSSQWDGAHLIKHDLHGCAAELREVLILIELPGVAKDVNSSAQILQPVRLLHQAPFRVARAESHVLTH